MLLPKLFTTLKNYSLEQFQRDLLAGVIVGVVALPLAIAFGIASGVTPERGLYTAILAGPAFSIAILAAVESLLYAVVADGMIGSRHRSNMELVAQGIANMVSPIFGGIPATGAIARTATNIKNGGRTPVAGLVHALTLLLITLFRERKDGGP